MNERTSQFGLYAGVIAGLLFAVHEVALLRLGFPPAGAQDLATWVEQGHFAIIASNESLGVGAALLVPFAIALGRHQGPRSLGEAGAGMLGLGAVVTLAVVIFEGRLVYPMFDAIPNDPASQRLLVQVLFGGLHLASLLFAAAVLLVGLASRHRGLSSTASYVVAGLTAAGSYPGLLGPLTIFVCRIPLSLWLIGYSRHLRTHESTTNTAIR